MSDKTKWALEGDHVVITFPTEPPVVIRWDLAQVEGAIQSLGEYRAQMQPEVPRDQPTTTGVRKVNAIANPRWYAETEVMGRGSLLHIRDPRFGWLRYLLPPKEMEALAGYLAKQVVLAKQKNPAKAN